jgi:hypothetical protein
VTLQTRSLKLLTVEQSSHDPKLGTSTWALGTSLAYNCHRDIQVVLEGD